MANPRQRRKQKSSTPKLTRRTNDKIRKHKIKGNAIIAANWNPKETLSQNYKRLGLVSRLSKQSGGTEIDLKEKSSSNLELSEHKKKRLSAGEAKIERDQQGNVVRVIYGKAEEDSESEHDDESEKQNDGNNPVIKALQQQAANGYVKPRTQSDREEDWIQRLVEKHGNDYDAMFWDKKLNIYQQSRGDLMRRIKKWNKKKNNAI